MHAKQFNPKEIDAVIFDMDGVITNTASTHAAAWKQMFDEYLRKRAEERGEQFQPFDAEVDYRHHVDGKPRYDGVKDFLESRGTLLPYGSPQDKPDQETICGLGNRKNRYFLERLKREGVKPYQSSVTFIKKLRTSGIRTAVISASRNAEAVLKAAGIRGLFDVKVDGVDSAELRLKGKPDPAIFLEAARRLDALPERTAIVEDSLAGVEAGRRGGFRMVIGVDRAGQGEEMKKRGADIVVPDLSQMEFSQSSPRQSARGRQTIAHLPSALEKKDEVFRQLRERTPAIFLDYDGTLTPIVDDPAKATLPEKTRKVIRRLAEHYSVAIISGRDLGDVQNMVGIGDIAYAGSHGFDIAGPGGRYRHDKTGKRFLPVLERAEKEICAATEDIPGAKVERKRFAIAVHYRQVESADVNTLEQRFDVVLSHYPELRKTTGKKVFELGPNIDWDKGKALIHLLGALYTDSSQILPVYIGDDVTDEDAFHAISDRGIAIAVGSGKRKTAARYELRDPEEVTKFLQELATLAEREVSKGVWVVAYEGFNPEQEGLREALCTLGNGYFATRGAAPESSADGVHYPGTYVTGCYNRLWTEINGRTVENEDLVNVPNWLPLNFRFQDEDWFDVGEVNLLEYRQELNLRQGVMSHLVRFVDEKGRRTRVFQRRFVSMANPHLAGLETTIVAENWSGHVSIRSALDGRVTNSGVVRYRQLNNQHLTPIETRSINNETICLQAETNQSHIRISEAARTRLFCDGERVPTKPRVIEEPAYIAQEFSIGLEEGKAVTIEKIVALCTSRDHAISESGIETRKQTERASSFDELLERHILSWDRLWRRCRIALKDSERVALILHLHIFHLLQTVSPHTIGHDAGVPPRGLHGEAYRGHILWDELFIFPFLNLRIPDITRALLLYRYRRLPEARWAARQAGYQGAMYPWQSGSDGREESQQLHLNPRSGRWIPDNSHLQRHINIAIAYNVWHYYQVSGNINFLSFYGAEMLIEIARFWANITRYNRSLDRYEINRVMGPDEFHDAYPDSDEPGINNNAYTNIMAVWVLCRALEAIELLPDSRREALRDKLGMRQEELERWEDISRKMRVVFHDDGIISQFEGYDKLKEFDWEGYQKKYGNIHRLDRILEAEGDTPNRYKLSKQADVLMLFYLLSADELGKLFRRLNYPFEYETIPRNVEYYLKRTVHGSTLSRVVHAWVLARSKRELSWHLFKEALESDVSDIQGGTTSEGIHLGAMAGTVDLIQRCYTGIETRQDRLQLNPYLPNDLKEIQFDILYRQHWLNLHLTSNRLVVSARPCAAAPITIGFREDTFELQPGDTLQFDLP
ncbi:MAG: trehalose-phosphatase [Chloroflexota bacterium]|nr:trehalose-phosphatase [Chloroflexota bacterium]